MGLIPSIPYATTTTKPTDLEPVLRKTNHHAEKPVHAVKSGPHQPQLE